MKRRLLSFITLLASLPAIAQVTHEDMQFAISRATMGAMFAIKAEVCGWPNEGLDWDTLRIHSVTFALSTNDITKKLNDQQKTEVIGQATSPEMVEKLRGLVQEQMKKGVCTDRLSPTHPDLWAQFVAIKKQPKTFPTKTTENNASNSKRVGQTSSALNGTWVIDPKQTAEHLIRVGPPSRNAEWIPRIVAGQCVTAMTFEEDTMIIESIGPFPMARSFRLEPKQGEELAYTIQTDRGGKDTVKISFLNEGSITVKFGNVELDVYGVWKRGNRPNPQTGESDIKQALDTCASALKSVPFLRLNNR